MRRLFGTDGIRGVANREPLTSETILKLGRAAASVFKNRAGRHRIVIGKDTRLSGYMLESALTSGICSMGVDVLLVGPLPTPAIAFLTRALRADAGAVISGSHNSFEDNGIKFFSRDGLKLPDEVEEQIEHLMDSGSLDTIRPTATEIGKAARVDDAAGRYIEFVKASLPKDLDMQGLRVVVDCANGAAYRVTPAVLRELGVQVTVLGSRPNGQNINKECGSQHPERLQQTVLREKADLGIAHDGDADRATFCTEHAEMLGGDQILAMLALERARQNRLPQRAVVTTVMSNLGLDLALRPAGISVVRTAVGDRYVLERMLKDGYTLGGEQSGHLIFLEHHTTGDGLITALQVLALMQHTGKRLSELGACMTLLPQVLENVKVAERRELDTIAEVKAAVERAEQTLAGRGRVLLRYSGTEPVVRIMVEGEEAAQITTIAKELAQCVSRHLTSPA